MSVVAVIFDFDDTLLPDSTSALLHAHGIDEVEFWSVRARGLIERGYDQPLAYLSLLLDEVRGGKLAGLTNADLAKFGESLDSTWFPGLPQLFDDLQKLVHDGYRDITIEFYIISGGLQAIVDGSEHVKKYFSGVYGCQLDEDPATGIVTNIKRCVTFTEKTRFLFEINKGIAPRDAGKNPYLVNEFVAAADRPVPMQNMIYVGDGLTDVPCFSLIQQGRGTPLGVLKPGAESAKQAFQKLLTTKRVVSVHSPDYQDSADLGTILRAAVATTCGNISVARARAV